MLHNGGELRIELNHRSFHELQEIFIEKTNDNRILAVAKNLSLEEQTKENGKSVILVSKDTLVRVKADAIGLLSQDFLNDRVVELDHIYSGFQEILVSRELLNQFYGKGSLLVSSITKETLHPNQFILMKDILGTSASAVALVDFTGKTARKLIFDEDHIWGVFFRTKHPLFIYTINNIDNYLLYVKRG